MACASDCDQVIDSDTDTRTTQSGIATVGWAYGQAFTMGSTARAICCASFRLNIGGFGSGESLTLKAAVYSVGSGTVGSNAIPGSLLASSSTITYDDSSSNPAYAFVGIPFATAYTLAASTDYILVAECTAVTGTVSVDVAAAGNSHAGNRVRNQGSWTGSSTYDCPFYAWYSAGAAGWTGKINSITNPAKVNGIAVANISKINGVS